MNSSIHPTNKTKNILILGEGFTQGIDDIIFFAEKKISTNFTRINTNFCLNLHYNGENSYLFVNATEIYQFKAKDSEIVPYSLCLGNVSQGFSVNNPKLDCMGMFMTLVLIIGLLQLMIY